MAERYADTVGPFLQGCPRTADALPPGDTGTQALYLWATAVIASYSFTIGSDRQAHVLPMYCILRTEPRTGSSMPPLCSSMLQCECSD